MTAYCDNLLAFIIRKYLYILCSFKQNAWWLSKTQAITKPYISIP